MVVRYPTTVYNDQSITEKKFIRTFTETVDDTDLVWHRDHNDRLIKIINGENWQLQYENDMPITLVNEQIYYIPKNEYHRLIKGHNDLVIEIVET